MALVTRVGAAEQSLPRSLEEAVSRGIITELQARRITALDIGGDTGPDTTPTAGEGGPGRLRAVVAEAVGYVGGALALVAVVILVQQFWADLRPWAQVSLLGVAAAGLLVAGAAVRPAEGPLDRLRGFLWALSAAGAGAAVGVGLSELTGLREQEITLVVGLAVVGYGAWLWRLHVAALQHLVVLGAVVVTAVAGVAVLEPSLVELSGLVLWAVGTAWALSAWAGWLLPQRVGLVAGAVLALLGPFVAPVEVATAGVLILGLVTAGLLVAVSVPLQQTVLLGLGVVGLVLYVPRIVFEYFGDTLGAPVSLLLTGILLVAVALGLARARSGGVGAWRR